MKFILNKLIKLKHPFDTEKSGSTVCLSLLYNKNLICANLGDSRTILCSCNEKNEWKASQLTKDHKPKEIEENNKKVKQKENKKQLSPIKNEENVKHAMKLLNFKAPKWAENMADKDFINMAKKLISSKKDN